MKIKIIFFSLLVLIMCNLVYANDLQEKYSIDCPGCTSEDISIKANTATINGVSITLTGKTNIRQIELSNANVDSSGGYNGNFFIRKTSTIKATNGVFTLAPESKASVKNGVLLLEKASEGSQVELSGKKFPISGLNIEFDRGTSSFKSKDEIFFNGRFYCCNAELSVTNEGLKISGKEVTVKENGIIIAKLTGEPHYNRETGQTEVSTAAIIYNNDNSMTIMPDTILSEFKNNKPIRDIKTEVELRYFSQSGKCESFNNNCLSIDKDNNLYFYIKTNTDAVREVTVIKYMDTTPYKIRGNVDGGMFNFKELAYTNDGAPRMDQYNPYLHLYSTVIFFNGEVAGEGSPTLFTGQVTYELKDGSTYKLNKGEIQICSGSNCKPLGRASAYAAHVNQNVRNRLKEQSSRIQYIQKKYGRTPMRMLGWLDNPNEQLIIDGFERAARITNINVDFLTAVAFQEGFNEYMETGYYYQPTGAVNGYGELGLDTFGDDVGALKRGGFLRQDFKEYSPYDTSNEHGLPVKSAWFDNLGYALEAQGARLKYAEAQFNKDLAQAGYDKSSVSDETRMMWTYAYYNAGRGSMSQKDTISNLLKSYGPNYIKTGRHAAAVHAKRVIATYELIRGIYDPLQIAKAE